MADFGTLDDDWMKSDQAARILLDGVMTYNHSIIRPPFAPAHCVWCGRENVSPLAKCELSSTP